MIASKWIRFLVIMGTKSSGNFELAPKTPCLKSFLVLSLKCLPRISQLPPPFNLFMNVQLILHGGGGHPVIRYSIFTTSQCRHVATSPRHHVTTSPRHHVTTSPRHHVTTSRPAFTLRSRSVHACSRCSTLF